MSADSTTFRCDFDDWEFSPRYTDGACPLCGWRPVDVTFELPLTRRIDWFLVMVAAVVGVSIVMGIVVIHAFTQA